jgi:small-conductance mechanosensitive channel
MTIPDWLPEILEPETLPGALVWAVVLLIVAAITRRLVRGLALRGARHFPDPTAATFLTQLLQVAVVLAAIIVYLHLVPGLRAVGTALLTGAGIFSIVLGLAAQSTLGNLIAGFAILLYHPFNVGDELQVNTPKGMVTGNITALTLGYTTLMTRVGEEVIVPNAVMASQVIIRNTRPAS